MPDISDKGNEISKVCEADTASQVMLGLRGLDGRRAKEFQVFLSIVGSLETGC